MKKINQILALFVSVGIVLTYSIKVSASVLGVSEARNTIGVQKVMGYGNVILDGGGGFADKWGQPPSSGASGPFFWTKGDPRGMTLYKDRAINSGGGPHGGSYYKLYNRKGQRIGTYNIDGVRVRD